MIIHDTSYAYLWSAAKYLGLVGELIRLRLIVGYTAHRHLTFVGFTVHLLGTRGNEAHTIGEIQATQGFTLAVPRSSFLFTKTSNLSIVATATTIISPKRNSNFE